MTIETDYIIIGAGATGLAFSDSLLAEADVDIVLVDRRDRPGGHWLDSYPFVRLHSASAFYGVQSLPLGANRLIETGHNAGFYEQASGAEICEYMQRVVDERLMPTGRARLLTRHEHLGRAGDLELVRDVETGRTQQVRVRRRVVDARYQEPAIPATHEPGFSIDPGVAFVPVGRMPISVDRYGRVVVIGGGKTAVDACLWLLDHGFDPERIRWVRPRDMWFTDRASMQPLDQIASLMTGLADEAQAAAEAQDLTDLCHRLETSGRFIRLDHDVEPTMCRGTMVSRSECIALQQVTDVVRRGRVRALQLTRIVLDDGEVPTGPDVLHVDCSASGLSPSPAVPIFGPGTITLQQVRHNSPTFNAALLGYVEAHRDDDVEKNRLCPPNSYASTTADFARMIARTWQTEQLWLNEPDVSAWVAGSRLNLLHGLADRMGDPAVAHAVNRFLTHVDAATERLTRLTASMITRPPGHPPK